MNLPCPWCEPNDKGDHASSCPHSGKLREEETGLPEYARPKKRIKKDEQA